MKSEKKYRTAMERFQDRELKREKYLAGLDLPEVKKKRGKYGKREPRFLTEPELALTPTGRLAFGDKRVVQKCIAMLDDMKFDDQYHFYTIEQAQKKLREIIQ